MILKYCCSFILLVLLSLTSIQAVEPLSAYSGQTIKGVDTSTLTGKVMTGYQGWFTCEGDGMDMGWTHWAKNRTKPFGPGNVTVDLWPDVSEYSDDELYETGFRLKDGSPAKVFSSSNKKTVLKHFAWMRDYGIDGAFVQRFANGLRSRGLTRQKNIVLSHAREGANLSGRAYAVMYDLSGLRKGGTDIVKEDWKRLRSKMEITNDPAYLKHEGKPVVSIWGIGFDDKRAYTLDECQALISFLKSDGCTVMVGVPSWWQSGIRDAISDPRLQKILAEAGIISPWTVGRYQTPKQAAQHAKEVWEPDVEWCKIREIDFLPVIYPGFSWHNLTGAPIDSIPRLKGEFLWSQFIAAKKAGAEMIYVAMFDEVDEGTAIIKCTNLPPVGKGVQFLDYKGLPSDYYLKITGLGGQMLRNEIPQTPRIPMQLIEGAR